MPWPLGELIVNKSPEAWILVLRGEHDLSTSDTLVAELDAVFAHGTRVVVDLGETTFVDSTILNALFHGYRRSQEKLEDALVVVAPPGSMARRILDLVGFGDVLPIYDSRNEALTAMSG